MAQDDADQDSIFTDAYVAAFSPRSKEACARQGVVPEDLIWRYNVGIKLMLTWRCAHTRPVHVALTFHTSYHPFTRPLDHFGQDGAPEHLQLARFKHNNRRRRGMHRYTACGWQAFECL